MRKTSLFHLAALFAIFSTDIFADDWDYHSVLSDNFILSVGAFRSSNSFDIEAGTVGDPGDRIDFGDNLGVSDHSTLVNVQLRWRFGSSRKWSLSGQYFSNNATGNAVLEEDYTWDDLTFIEGSYAESGVKFEIARVFLGYSFVKNEQNDFGIGFGIHNLDLSAYIEGEIRINDGTTGVRRADAGASQILPNIGAWYAFSPAKRWLLHARVDWISASINDYDGTMWNVSGGINFQAWRHVGFDLSWQYFDLDVTATKSDWTGNAKLTYNGPVLGMTLTW